MNNETMQPHSIFLDNRSKMEIEGISDVESFTDTSIVANSTMGDIVVDGTDLKVDSFSSQTGKLVIKGLVDSIYYFTKSKDKKRIFSSRRNKE